MTIIPRRRQTSSDEAVRLFPKTTKDVSSLRETAEDYKAAYPWVDELAIEITLAVHACYWDAKETETNLYASMGLGRTAGRFTVLRAVYLSEEHRLTQNEIATKLSISSATVTFLVDGLQKDGFVAREANEADRRSVHVVLTPDGEQVCTRVVPEIARLSGQYCQNLTQQEKETFLSFLMKFRQNAALAPTNAEG